MKLSLALVFTAFQGVFATSELQPIRANSKAGIALLSKARVLEGENNENNDGNTSWMQGFSIKFLGCHHVAAWNQNENMNDGDVRISVNRHVRFRLCPSDTCSLSTNLGCTSGFGDYVVDMSTFLTAFIQNREEDLEKQCEETLNNCDCDDNDDKDMCQYKCYVNAGMSACVDENPYYDENNQGDNKDLADYTYCTQMDFNNDDGTDYFMGPYCADQGDQIHMGLFTDDTCTEFADNTQGSTTFYTHTGSSIPFRDSSIVDRDCYSCKDSSYYDDDDNTNELCTTPYAASGKCETKLSDSLQYPNENACTYIEGIKLLKHTPNGIIYRPYYGTKSAAIAIAIFAFIFVVLAFYVCLLRNKVAARKAFAARAAGGEVSPREKKRFLRSVKKKLSFKKNTNKKKDALI